MMSVALASSLTICGGGGGGVSVLLLIDDCKSFGVDGLTGKVASCQRVMAYINSIGPERVTGG